MTSFERGVLQALLALQVLLPPAVASAQTPATPAAADSDRVYDRTDVMIPMRDGVRLNTMILRPRGVTEPLLSVTV